MLKTQVTLNGDGTFKAITVNRPSHHIKIIELGLSPVGLIAKWPDDNFTASYNYAAGAVIKRSGNGYYGVLGYHANAIAGKTRPADTYVELKASDGSAKVIELTEYAAGEEEV